MLMRTAGRVLWGALLLCVLLCGGAEAATASSWPWRPPLAGPLVVRRGFDPPLSRWGPGHRGVDLAALPGALVRAPAPGVVAYAGPVAGRGVLVIRHGTLRTTYEPVLALVPVGAPVAARQPVARLLAGHLGPALPGEALLHWGVLRGGTYLDPLSLLRRGPSRLVPVSRAPPFGTPALAAVPGAAVALGHAAPAGDRGGGDTRRGPALPHGLAASFGGGLAGLAYVSRAGRRASRAAAARPSCASGRCGSRSHPGPGRSPPA